MSRRTMSRFTMPVVRIWFSTRHRSLSETESSSARRKAPLQRPNLGGPSLRRNLVLDQDQMAKKNEANSAARVRGYHHRLPSAVNTVVVLAP